MMMSRREQTKKKRLEIQCKVRFSYSLLFEPIFLMINKKQEEEEKRNITLKSHPHTHSDTIMKKEETNRITVFYYSANNISPINLVKNRRRETNEKYKD